MNEWEPKTLCDCVGSEPLGWTVFWLAWGVLIWYSVIAYRWWQSAKASSGAGQRVWQCMVAIFAVCAMAGYGSWIVAMYAPKIAVMIRVAVLVALNVICPVWLHHARHRTFRSVIASEGFAERIFKAVRTPQQLEDRELASLVRTLVAESLKREASDDRCARLV